MIDDVAVVSSLPLKCKYSKIFIYPNGSVKYTDRFGTTLHEGNAKRIGQIKKDILSWEPKVNEEEQKSNEVLKENSEPPITGFFRE